MLTAQFKEKEKTSLELLWWLTDAEVRLRVGREVGRRVERRKVRKRTYYYKRN